jgi:hypothetical protein
MPRRKRNLRFVQPIRGPTVDAKVTVPVRRKEKDVQLNTPTSHKIGFPISAKPRFQFKKFKLGYTPINLTVFTAAFSGAVSGLAGSQRWLQDIVETDYAGFASISGAFAASFDEAWEVDPDTNPPNTLQVFVIEKTCKAVWESRGTEVNIQTLSISTFTELCKAIIALVLASDDYFVAQGITPDPWPSGSGTITEVAAGTGISVSTVGSVATVSNTGVLALTAGLNVSITGTAQNPVINSSGGAGGIVDSVTAGTGSITVTGSAANPLVNNTATTQTVAAGTGISVATVGTTTTVTNTGVLTVAAGTGSITVTGTAANPVINNTATTQTVAAGTGISVATVGTTTTVTNTGVLTVAAGTGSITVTGTAANPVINNTATTQTVAAGTGISVATVGTTTTVTNTGVLTVTAGTNVTITGTASNPVINASVPSGTSQTIRFAVTNTPATQNSVSSIPNGALILNNYFDVTTPFPGATVTIGNAGSPSFLQATTDNDPTTANTYQVGNQDLIWTGPATIQVAITGAPASGAGFVVVEYVATPLT